MAQQILSGIKILDLSRVLAGPWCTQALADMGATVYKIERPGVGDEMRHSPPFLRDINGEKTTDTTSYICVNRGKKSITVDFTKPEGRQLILQLVDRCDVLVENFKVGDLQRYGLDYESLKERNPGLIYCSVTGYGQEGPHAHLPGYDPVFQALTGIMSTCGRPDDEPGGGPMRSTLPLIDVMTGMTATSTILGALFHRERTGEGQQLDVALLDVAIAATVHLGQTYLSTGAAPRRVGNGSLLFAPSGVFPCRNGGILIQIGNDVQWQRLCKAVEREDLLRNEAYTRNAQRMERVKELTEIVSGITLQWDKNELAQKLGASGVPCGPVNSIDEAFEHPQVKYRELRTEIDHPVHGRMPVIRSPFRFGKTPVEHRAPPVFGADTVSVLREELGMSQEVISELGELDVI